MKGSERMCPSAQHEVTFEDGSALGGASRAKLGRAGPDFGFTDLAAALLGLDLRGMKPASGQGTVAGGGIHLGSGQGEMELGQPVGAANRLRAADTLLGLADLAQAKVSPCLERMRFHLVGAALRVRPSNCQILVANATSVISRSQCRRKCTRFQQLT